MEISIFIGLQGSGKSSFYKERLFQTHVRISLDLLKTRFREWQFFQLCLRTRQSLVIDNTNPTRTERSKYIAAARDADYRVIGYYFQSITKDCLTRNEQRFGNERVPDIAIISTIARLERPTLSEGFDQLFYVCLGGEGFSLEEWRDEI